MLTRTASLRNLSGTDRLIYIRNGMDTPLSTGLECMPPDLPPVGTPGLLGTDHIKE